MSSGSDHQATVIDGKAIAQTIRSEIASEIKVMSEKYGQVPGLAVVIVGNRKDSQSYVNMKRKSCAEVGINSFDVNLPEDVPEAELISKVHELNANPDVHGILVQLPLPKHINEEKVLGEISLEKDVDGFHPLNIGKLAMKGRDPLFLPCTPKAGCLELLFRSGVTIKGKKAVVVGRSNIVGLPVSLLLLKEDATVTIVHSRTKDPENFIREADIVIAAAGQPMMIKGSWIKPGAAVIDVGTNAVDDPTKKSGYRLVGDVDFQEASKVAGCITPVPGGVGPLTVAMLLKNTLDGAKRVIEKPQNTEVAVWINRSTVVAHEIFFMAAALHHHHFRHCLFVSPLSRKALTVRRPKAWLLTSPGKSGLFQLSCSSSSTSPPPSPSSPEVSASAATAESCVNLGLSLFSKGRVKDALEQFDKALTLEPNPIEAQAALYNKACCHAYRAEGKKAADCLRIALREYNLKFGTILNDPDLASFRASPEFKELQEEAKLGGEDIGYSFRRDLKLISEVQAPFRGVRRFFYVAFIAAAGISTFFTIPRLIRAIQGGDGAPDIWETAGNAAINIVGIVVIVALFLWDNKKEEEQIAQITRDETLSRLPLRLSTNRIVELVQLRDTVILAGKKETVTLAMKNAERFRTELLRRGVLLVPIIWGEGREPQTQKKGFGVSRKAASSLPSIGEDFEKRTESVIAQSKLKAEIRFKAEAVSPVEWERWIRDQQKSEGVTPGEDVYIILRLDGRVRRSGKGMPDWAQIAKELPEMEALLSKLER
nr:protein LOW PSII ACCUMULATION 1, chloroplastic [Ipomoea batatas]